jgi:protein O-mannosyl-transferase
MDHCKKQTSWQRVCILLGLPILTFVTFLPVLHCGFTDLDDPQYVWQNPHVLEGMTAANIRWAFTATDVGYWQPLSWLSLMLDSTLFGVSAHGYHLTNLLLHCISVAVVFLVLENMTACRWRSVLVAVLYAIHPLRVESVAWVAERKDVLSNLLAWIAIGGYVYYCRRPSAKRYLAVLIPFALALLAKPMAVTLPCLLLLLDYWPLERWKSGSTILQLIKEKIPLLLLALAAAVATIIAQYQCDAVAPLTHLSLSTRLVIAMVGYFHYIENMAWFANLTIMYPLPRAWPPMLVLRAAFVLAGITILAVWNRKERPWLIVGWLWFLGVMAPVSGLFQSGPQAMADRFTYLPSVGLLIMLAWSLREINWNSFRAWKPWLLATVTIAMLCFTTWMQAEYWQDTQTIFSQALIVTDKNNWIAEDELGLTCFRGGDETDAAAFYRAALKAHPTDPVANFNLGLTLARYGKFREAVLLYRTALQTTPAMFEAHNALGEALGIQGDLLGAFTELRRAQELNPNFAPTFVNLGALYMKIGDLPNAVAAFGQAARLNPTDKQAKKELAQAQRLASQAKASADVRD